MKTLIPAAIRCSLMFTGVAALSLAYPASVQAVPTTYEYTGNTFTQVSGPYTTSDFVTALVRLAAPLAPNMPLTFVTPTAFTFSDGAQTITNLTADSSSFVFQTNGTGEVTMWAVNVHSPPSDFANAIGTFNTLNRPADEAVLGIVGFASNIDAPGTWTRASVHPSCLYSHNLAI